MKTERKLKYIYLPLNLLPSDVLSLYSKIHRSIPKNHVQYVLQEMNTVTEQLFMHKIECAI